MYKIKDIEKEANRFFKGNALASNVWITKYLMMNGDKYMELKPEDTYRRIAKEIARIDQVYNEQYWYELLEDQVILPAGSPMASIGNPYNMSSLGNCFVVGNEGEGSDSYAGILHIDALLAYIMKRRGGVGHDLSHLRPKDARIHNSANYSTGIIPWMERYSNTTREVAQGGRRGALMLSLDVTHPDIMDFLSSKEISTKITGANISVKFYDDFMQAVLDDTDYELKFISEYETITKVLKAREVWNKFIHNAWLTAEPGALFWDTIIEDSLPDCYADVGFKSTSTNPCGEIILSNHGECLLTSLNLTKFIQNPFTKLASIDWEDLGSMAYITQRFMDNVVQLEMERVREIIKNIDSKSFDNKELFRDEIMLWHNIYKTLKEGRRTGASGIGIGDTLAMLNLRFDSEDAIKVSEEIYKAFAVNSYASSIDMAQERGHFEVWDIEKEKDNDFLKRILANLPQSLQDNYKKYGRRNIANLTIPPSGSISALAKISSGIEPVFMVSYIKRRKVDENHTRVDFIDANGDKWENYNILHHNFVVWYSIFKDINIEDAYTTLTNMIEKDIDIIIKSSPYYGSTSKEIDPLQKVKMQGKVQQWVDHSISNTINLPNDVTEEEISDIYLESWKQGLKGVTIYREGSRDGVLISKNDKPKTTESSIITKSDQVIKRPKKVEVEIHYPTLKGEEWVVIVGMVDNLPYEVFTFKKRQSTLTTETIGFLTKERKGIYSLDAGKKTIDNVITLMHNDVDEELEIVTQLVSALLRHVELDIVVNTLHKPGFITSSSKVIARILKKYINDTRFDTVGGLCPECGEYEMVMTDGCEKCLNCGHSKCS